MGKIVRGKKFLDALRCIQRTHNVRIDLKKNRGEEGVEREKMQDEKKERGRRGEGEKMQDETKTKHNRGRGGEDGEEDDSGGMRYKR